MVKSLWGSPAMQTPRCLLFASALRPLANSCKERLQDSRSVLPGGRRSVDLTCGRQGRSSAGTVQRMGGQTSGTRLARLFSGHINHTSN